MRVWKRRGGCRHRRVEMGLGMGLRWQWKSDWVPSVCESDSASASVRVSESVSESRGLPLKRMPEAFPEQAVGWLSRPMSPTLVSAASAASVVSATCSSIGSCALHTRVRAVGWPPTRAAARAGRSQTGS